MMDLHIHSKFSDGDKAIPELISIIKEKRVDLFSITDHDSLESIQVLQSVPNICYIPGVEMSCVDQQIKMHILGYGISYDSPLGETCKTVQNTRRELTLEILEDLLKRGYVLLEDDLNDLYQNHSSCMGKVEVAKKLVHSGYASTVSDAFYGILDRYKIGNRIRRDAEQIISEIHLSGGLAILAHPFEIVRKQKVPIDPVVDGLLPYGLDGMEVFTTKHDSLEEKYIYQLCQAKELLMSGGSDYHGPLTTPDISIGEAVKEEMISERIKQKRIQH